jgi:hypothetical protein
MPEGVIASALHRRCNVPVPAFPSHAERLLVSLALGGVDEGKKWVVTWKYLGLRDAAIPAPT